MPRRVPSIRLGAAARTLLPRVGNEEHAAVRAAIALAVAHRQWEPGGSKRVLALRTWASGELSTQGYDVNPFGPAFTRISDMGGPQRPPRVPPTAAEPTTSEPSAAAPTAAESSTEHSVPTNPRVPTS